MAMRNASQDLDIGFEPKNMDASILFFGQRWRLATAAVCHTAFSSGAATHAPSDRSSIYRHVQILPASSLVDWPGYSPEHPQTLRKLVPVSWPALARPVSVAARSNDQHYPTISSDPSSAECGNPPPVPPIDPCPSRQRPIWLPALSMSSCQPHAVPASPLLPVPPSRRKRRLGR